MHLRLDLFNLQVSKELWILKKISITIFLISRFYRGFYGHPAVCPYGAYLEEELQLFWFLIG